MSTNLERADRIELLLTQYSRTLGNDDAETTAIDLLADLHHWSNQRGINITRAINQAKSFFREELEDAGWGAQDL